MPAPEARFMQEAIALAALGRGHTHPNPGVGAVVVCRGRIVGRGYHKGPGRLHAEAEALREAGELARGADLYVTLEPCNTFGRTPPCTRAIVESGVARVVAAVADPNPRVSGRGAADLREAGLDVVLGFLEEEGRAVDPSYHSFHRNGRPFVHLKWAQSLDGAVTRSGWNYLTGPEALERVHRERLLADAILVSAGTVLSDDPRLTVRLKDLGHPKPLARVILDGRARLTGGEQVFATAPEHGPVWVVRPPGSGPAPAGAEVLEVSRKGPEGFDLESLLLALKDRAIVYLYVEAVGRLAASFLSQRLVDRLSVHLAPMVLGRNGALGAVDGALPAGLSLEGATWERLGRDWAMTLDMEGRCLRD